MNQQKMVTALIACLLAVCFLAGTSACSFSNQQPRTVEATKAKFDNGAFTPGSTTQEEVKAELGSPARIDQHGDGGETWGYVKAEEVGLTTVTTDTGTNYIAEYTFDGEGVLQNASYRAEPMGSPFGR